jgi:5-formyltetrahydrofolate cyclo-ligase
VSDFSIPSASPETQAHGDSAAAKVRARSLLIKARRGRSEDELRRADQAILKALSDFVQETQPATIAVYKPFGTEPGARLPRPLPDYFTESTAPLGVLVPVLKPDKDLDWRDWRAPHGPGAISEADLVIVPALAVDRSGVRLGRGGGSYDRALARVRPGTPVVALLHDGELAHKLPAQPHDERVTAVITPATGMLRLPLRVDDYSGPVPLLALDL